MARFSPNSDARFEVLQASDGSIEIDIYAETLQKVDVKINYHDFNDGGDRTTLDLPAGRRT